jgi:hypothetical protein
MRDAHHHRSVRLDHEQIGGIGQCRPQLVAKAGDLFASD